MASGAVWCRCRAKWDEGTPLLVEWLKDGVMINFSSDVTNNRFSLLPNNALVVNFAKLEDSGVYTCRASTPFDVASANATLIVRKGKERLVYLVMHLLWY